MTHSENKHTVTRREQTHGHTHITDRRTHSENRHTPTHWTDTENIHTDTDNKHTDIYRTDTRTQKTDIENRHVDVENRHTDTQTRRETHSGLKRQKRKCVCACMRVRECVRACVRACVCVCDRNVNACLSVSLSLCPSVSHSYCESMSLLQGPPGRPLVMERRKKEKGKRKADTERNDKSEVARSHLPWGESR